MIRSLVRSARRLSSLDDAYRGKVNDASAQAGRTALQLSIDNKVGGLRRALDVFSKHGINLLQLHTREIDVEASPYITVYCDFEGHKDDANIRAARQELLATQAAVFCSVLYSARVYQYPKRIQDLDEMSAQTLVGGGDDLPNDPNDPHPGFNDEAYKARRREVTALAVGYKYGTPLPRLEYTPEETRTWGKAWATLTALFSDSACRQFNAIVPLMAENCGYSETNVPQLADVSAFLQRTTGFTLRPVSGLLCQRDFLNALAFRVFCSTQYMRHSSRPLYTPEPDVIHELAGHAPMFADPDFADFSQQIGLASLGASDEEIERLGSIYWFTLEFGLVREPHGNRAYGAGLLSSFGELQYACGRNEKKPQLVPFSADQAAVTKFPITTYQPSYFVAESLADVKRGITDYSKKLSRPFEVVYNPYAQCVRTVHNKTSQYVNFQL